VRSALVAVNGVQEAQVFFEGNEAVVRYDPTRCSVADLIAAVAAVKDPAMPVQFRAELKK
jgi:copper chaperone CopZ